MPGVSGTQSKEAACMIYTGGFFCFRYRPSSRTLYNLYNWLTKWHIK